MKALGRMAALALLIGAPACMQQPDPGEAIDGSWQTTKIDTSAVGPTLSFGLDGETLEMKSSAGESYSAKLDGTETKVAGSPEGLVVSVERAPAIAFRQIYKRAGKTVAVATVTVIDRKYATIIEQRSGSTSLRVMEKQAPPQPQ